MSITIDAAVINDMGRTRTNNEDNYFFNGLYMTRENLDKGSGVSRLFRQRTQNYAVCDGLGGVDAGEEASLFTVTRIGDIVKKFNVIDAPDEFCREIQDMSDDLFRQSASRGGKSGTTLAMLSISREMARVANVGDSRVYMVRGDAIKQLSIDHSEVQRMIAMGVITPEEGRLHPKRHIISQYMGMPPDEMRLSVTTSKPIPLAVGDCFILCSDGLTDMVEDAEILNIAQSASNASQAASALVELALKRGGKDNVTVMCVYVEQVSSSRTATKLKGLRTACAILSCASLLVFTYYLMLLIGIIAPL